MGRNRAKEIQSSIRKIFLRESAPELVSLTPGKYLHVASMGTSSDLGFIVPWQFGYIKKFGVNKKRMEKLEEEDEHTKHKTYIAFCRLSLFDPGSFHGVYGICSCRSIVQFIENNRLWQSGDAFFDEPYAQISDSHLINLGMERDLPEIFRDMLTVNYD